MVATDDNNDAEGGVASRVLCLLLEEEGDESGCSMAAILTGSVGSCRGSWLKSGFGSRGVGGNMGKEDMSGGGRPVAEGPSGGIAATRSVSFGSSRLPIIGVVILLTGERSRGFNPPGTKLDEGEGVRMGLVIVPSFCGECAGWTIVCTVFLCLLSWLEYDVS